MESYATVTEAIDGLKARGFNTNFEFMDGRFVDVGSDRRFEAAELTIVEHHRFEGNTDSADESIVYAIQSQDGIRGIVVDAFGVYADPELATFLRKVVMPQHR